MKKYTCFILSILAMLLTISGCKKSTETQTIPKSSGYFVLTQMKSDNELKSILKNTFEDPSPGFDLGEIKASKEFYFILTNGGEEPIFDIQLSSSVPAFQITPSEISYLPGRTTINGGTEGGFIPLITLGVTHGIRLNGVGFAPLLPVNSNSAIIRFSGKTLNNEDTITVSQDFEMSVIARVMDIRFFDGQAEVDLAHPTGGAFTLGPMGSKTYRLYNISNGSLEVENTGNVPILVSTYEHNTFLDSIRLEPGIRKAVTVVNLSNIHALVFDGQGTITHPERIELFDEGKGCFCIMHF